MSKSNSYFQVRHHSRGQAELAIQRHRRSVGVGSQALDCTVPISKLGPESKASSNVLKRSSFADNGRLMGDA